MIFRISLPCFPRSRWGLSLVLPAVLLSAIATTTPSKMAHAQAPPSGQAADGRALRIDSDIQEANSQTGVFTARGNVQINYPARQIQATAAQAQYFSKERRIVLSGDVYVLQQGNSIRGETITYLIDEERFIANPKTNAQVESIYIISDPSPNQTAPVPPATAPQTPPLNLKPAPKPPATPTAPQR